MGLSPLVVKAVVLIDLNVWLYIVSILCIFIFIYWGIYKWWHYSRLVKYYVQLFLSLPIQGHPKPSPRQYASRPSKVSFGWGPRSGPRYSISFFSAHIPHGFLLYLSLYIRIRAVCSSLATDRMLFWVVPYAKSINPLLSNSASCKFSEHW